jgi:hypothetical protein
MSRGGTTNYRRCDILITVGRLTIHKCGSGIRIQSNSDTNRRKGRVCDTTIFSIESKMEELHRIRGSDLLGYSEREVDARWAVLRAYSDRRRNQVRWKRALSKNPAFKACESMYLGLRILCTKVSSYGRST